jgi:DNA-binding transcriptional LysR family regulator
MDRIRSIEIFVRLVETGSFTAAAADLRIPRSTVSTVLQQLEARIGAQLIYRTTRQVKPTRDGSVYYDRCLQLLRNFAETEELFRGDGMKPRGRLRIDTPTRIATGLIAPALPDFLARYPDVDVDLGVADRRIDLVAEGVDAAIRVGDLDDSDFIVRRIGVLRRINCVSLSYASSHGVPKTLDDLARHWWISFAPTWNARLPLYEFSKAAGPCTVKVSVNNSEALLACCRAGLGFIQVPEYDVRPLIEAGELIEILPDHPPAPVSISILYPPQRHLSPRLRVFVDWFNALVQDRMLD